MASVENKILITGAAGQYGRLVVEGLLEKGVSPSSLLLLTRNPSKLAEYASRGVDIRKGSFDDPVPDLAGSFAGAKTMLLISTSRAGKRLPQHQTAIDAGVKAGVTHIVYTSFLSAHLEDPTALVGKEHRATGTKRSPLGVYAAPDQDPPHGPGTVHTWHTSTHTHTRDADSRTAEAMLRASGAHWTALRDAQYAEAVTDVVGPGAVRSGVVRVNAGGGRMAFVARADCAAAAVGVLAGPARHRGRAYHITGPELLGWGDAARIMGEVAGGGRPVSYEPLTDDEQQAVFDAMGIPREPVDDLVVK